jgi:hypothetical protein
MRSNASKPNAGCVRSQVYGPMHDDAKALTESSGRDRFSYVDLRDVTRAQRACERWPLLSSVRRYLVQENALAKQPAATLPRSAAALWEQEP